MKPPQRDFLITVLVGVALAMLASKAEEKPDTASSAGIKFSSDLKLWEPKSLTIQAGKTYITIKPDGIVELGKDVSLDEATRMFWDKVGVQFGHFHDAVIAGYEARKREEDMRDVVWNNLNEKSYQMGFRSDGIVVWREAKKQP